MNLFGFFKQKPVKEMTLEEELAALTPEQRKRLRMRVLPDLIIRMNEFVSEGSETKERMFDRLVDYVKDLR